MMFKLFFFLLLSFNLYALEYIKQNYYIDSHDINSTLFFKDKENILLYTIPKHLHSLRIKKTQLEKLLKNNGFKNFNIESRYVYFEMKSPIDTTKIENFLREHYKNKYKQITINSIHVQPRSYMDTLPRIYNIHIRSKNHLSKDGILSIEDNQNKKYFFDYTIDAKLKVLISKEKIHRNEELSKKNTAYATLKLDKFRALPLQKLRLTKYQAKYNLKTNSVITVKDIKKLSLVKRDSMVTVWINNAGMSISFSAKALQNGKLNDIITIQKNDGKRLKAKVVAKQRVEVR